MKQTQQYTAVIWSAFVTASQFTYYYLSRISGCKLCPKLVSNLFILIVPLPHVRQIFLLVDFVHSCQKVICDDGALGFPTLATYSCML